MGQLWGGDGCSGPAEVLGGPGCFGAQGGSQDVYEGLMCSRVGFAWQLIAARRMRLVPACASVVGVCGRNGACVLVLPYG